MRLTFVNHASMLIEHEGICVWSDPWLAGTSFNNSWGLLAETPESVVDYALKKATHIYISHEHPDHFHIPSLRRIAKARSDIAVIIQNLNAKKMPHALRDFGFTNITEMHHRQMLRCGGSTFYLYQVFPLDSAFALLGNEGAVLNLNDTDLSPADLAAIREDLPYVDVVLNQFSLATYDGRENTAAITDQYKANLIEAFCHEHRFLGAHLSVPFASFSYFCNEENSALNAFRTRMQDLTVRTRQRNVPLIVMQPGAMWRVGDVWDNEPALHFWEQKIRSRPPLLPTPGIDINELIQTIAAFIAEARRNFTIVPFFFIGTLRFYLPDLEQVLAIDFLKNRIRHETATELSDYDVKVKSQPLWFAFKYNYGMQTLSISGRLHLRRHIYRFMLLRIICALGNSEYYLAPWRINRNLLRFLYANFGRITMQAFHSLKIIRAFTS